jgi:hypothetical protein
VSAYDLIGDKVSADLLSVIAPRYNEFSLPTLFADYVAVVAYEFIDGPIIMLELHRLL